MGLLKAIIGKYYGSIVRHLLTGLGGALVSIGVLQAEALQSFVDLNGQILIGLIVYAAGQWLSFEAKKK